MNYTSLIRVVIVSIAILPLQISKAIDADSLAKHLNIQSWQTKVELPAESFISYIYRIKDGKLSDIVMSSPSDYAKVSNTPLTIVIGATEAGYKITSIYNHNTTTGVETGIKRFDSTASIPLPESISEGDYVLFGRPQRGTRHSADDISNYADGFLLRIKNTAQQDAAANP